MGEITVVGGMRQPCRKLVTQCLEFGSKSLCAGQLTARHVEFGAQLVIGLANDSKSSTFPEVNMRVRIPKSSLRRTPRCLSKAQIK